MYHYLDFTIFFCLNIWKIIIVIKTKKENIILLYIMFYNSVKDDSENSQSLKEKEQNEAYYDGYILTDNETEIYDDYEIDDGSDSDSNETKSVVDIEKTNPVYDNVRYDYSLYTDYSNEDLCDLFIYKQKTEKNNKELVDIIKFGDEALKYNYERAYTIKEKIRFYWIGLTDNVIHKRTYLKYNERILGLSEKADYIHKRLDVLKERKKITQNEENQIIIDIEGIYKLLHSVLVESIIFMCNAKAPIGDFIDFFTETKKNILMVTNIKENKLFVNKLCSIEIKHGKENIIKNVKKKYDEKHSHNLSVLNNAESQIMDDFSKKFADELEKDKNYIRKEFLLESMKYILDENLMNRGKNNLKYIFVRYKKRQDIYYQHIEKLFVLNRLYKEKERLKNGISSAGYIENTYELDRYIDYMKYKLVMIDENIKHEKENIITKEYTDEIESLQNGLFKQEPSRIYDWYTINYKTYFARQSFFYREYNIRIINDILDVIRLFEKNYKLHENTKDYLVELEKKIQQSLELEKKVEEEIIRIRKSTIKKGEPLLEKYEKMDEPLTNVYSERELWWYYYRYDIYNRRGEKDKELPDTVIHQNNEIRDLSFARNYRFAINPFGPNGGSHPDIPLNRGVVWDDMDHNLDKIDYSKRQLIYNKYLMSNLSEEEMEEKCKKEEDEGVKDIIRIEMLIESIRTTQDIFNELEKMGDFIKDGVLINDQLFFKFILFGINVLIFIGQYFWTEHIEPNM